MVLRDYYRSIPDALAQARDILVWRGIAPLTTPHSAILIDPILTQGKTYLDYTAILQTKNGLSIETPMTLYEIIDIYGESYNVYQRR